MTLLVVAGSSAFFSRQFFYGHSTKSMPFKILFHTNALLDFVRSGVSLDCIGNFVAPKCNKVNANFVHYMLRDLVWLRCHCHKCL